MYKIDRRGGAEEGSKNRSLGRTQTVNFNINVNVIISSFKLI